MSRSGYSSGCTEWSLICWRGSVTSAIRVKRGQAFLREMLTALEAMPNKRLIATELDVRGEVCAIGAVCAARKVDVSNIEPEDAEQVARVVGLAPAMVREIVFINDEDGPRFREETPEQRWTRVRQWVLEHIA